MSVIKQIYILPLKWMSVTVYPYLFQYLQFILQKAFTVDSNGPGKFSSCLLLYKSPQIFIEDLHTAPQPVIATMNTTAKIKSTKKSYCIWFLLKGWNLGTPPLTLYGVKDCF